MLGLSLETGGLPSYPGFSELHSKDPQIPQAPQLLADSGSMTSDILSGSSFVCNFTSDLHVTSLIPGPMSSFPDPPLLQGSPQGMGLLQEQG